MSVPTLRDDLKGRRFGLVLSAGYFGFFGHAGFLEALAGAGLWPSAFAGTSAGGLVAAHAAAGVSPSRISELLLRQRREHFWDPDPIGALAKGLRGPGFTGLLRGERFRRLLSDSLPVQTFEQCQTPLVLVATNLTQGRSEVFHQGPLAPAVHATCAYPGLFRAVELHGQLYWDGGILDKAPAVALVETLPTKLDALVVHYLPSRQGGPAHGPFAYAKAMAAGMTASRREHFELQTKLLRARGLEVYVVSSELPAVGPSALHRGREALEAARAQTARALESAVAAA